MKLPTRITVLLMVVFGLLINSQPVHTQSSYYTWTDEKGKVRFANDLSEVPDQYKKLAVPGPTRKGTKETVGGSEQPRSLRDSTITASSIPKFQVVGQCETDLAILVPQNTTAEQLKALIFEFRAARKGNTLSKMIPPTTPGQRVWIKEKRSYTSSDYISVWIFVFSEPVWATSDKLRRFIDSNLISAADQEFNKEYIKHIRAQYYWSLTSKLEDTGNLGFDDEIVGVFEGHVKSPDYEKLF